MATQGEQNHALITAITDVSERVTVLVREEIELAKAEMTQKVSSLSRGAAAVAAGAVFGIFAVVMGLLTLAWGLNSALDSLWIGFAITFVLLLVLAGGAVMFALKAFKKGSPPTPTMAIDEAKKIRETVSQGSTPATGSQG